MFRRFKFTSKRNFIIVVSVMLLVISALLAAKVKFVYHEDREGIFIFKGQNGSWLEISDDLFPEQVPRLLWSFLLPKLKVAKEVGACNPTESPCTHFEWNEQSGRGSIKTSYPDGKKLVINLGRFISSNGKNVSGLFLGGNLPPNDPDFRLFDKNETGMAYFDGTRYFHIWCNVNESIVAADDKLLYPSEWTFLSSKILESSANDLTITSKHQVMVNKIPVSIERTLFYQTGDTFITLITKLKNIGNKPTELLYVYGDEPWLGNFGSSEGNIGWYKDGLITTEMTIDTAKYHYFGLFDHGNPLIGETGNYTGKANFIEWSQETRPDLAYISNQFGPIPSPEKKVPLKSLDNRVLALEWGPKTLDPGQSLVFALKVGMAENDPKSGFPLKPDTNLY